MRRLLPLVALAALLAIALPAQAGQPAVAAKKRSCGVVKGAGDKYRFKVVSLRRVSCKGARKVAKRYDRFKPLPRGWACGLGHGKTKVMFSCGKGASSGNLRKWPYALLAIRVKK